MKESRKLCLESVLPQVKARIDFFHSNQIMSKFLKRYRNYILNFTETFIKRVVPKQILRYDPTVQLKQMPKSLNVLIRDAVRIRPDQAFVFFFACWL